MLWQFKENAVEKDFTKQCYAAQNILKNKLKIWYQKLKQYVPVYVCDYMFYRDGEVAEMLQIDPNYGFIFDPKTLEDGIETVFSILEATEKGNIDRAKGLYLRFGTPEIRVLYIRKFIDKLSIYHAIGNEVIADLDAFAMVCDDP